MNIDEINRLVKRGLSLDTAMAVADGRLNEEFEVDQRESECKAREWAIIAENRELTLVPQWDCNSARFYLCMDGSSPTVFDKEKFCLIDADVAEVAAHLVFNSSRTEEPWCEQYSTKTSKIAYRWANGLQVTPPLIAYFKDELTIVGGMHRFHLAKHHNAVRMPFLIKVSELDKILGLLKASNQISSSDLRAPGTSRVSQA